MIDDLRHVRSFLAAARTGNFTRAAAELHLSQSAFTVQIRQLEEALGVRLFDRSRRRVALTTAGRELCAPMERLVVDAESIVAGTRQLAGLRRGVVSLAVLPSVAAQILPAILRRFTERYPGIVVQVRDVVAERVIEMVKREEVDFGIGSRLQADRALATNVLLVDRLCAFVPVGHALAQKSAATLRELAAAPLIVTGRDSSVREILERAIKREKLSLTIAYEMNYLSSALSMARAGLGVAVLPESAAGGLRDEVKTVRIARPVLSRRIELIQRADRRLSPAASQMVALLLAEFARQGQESKLLAKRTTRGQAGRA